jgi:hypothetical protein
MCAVQKQPRQQLRLRRLQRQPQSLSEKS